MGVSVSTNHGSTGVEVHGLTQADLADEGIRRMLHNLWLRHGLVIFRMVEGEAFHLALSEMFGSLVDHPIRDARQDGNSKLINIRNDPAKRTIFQHKGRPTASLLPWHKDLVYMAQINRGGVLRPIVLPATDGETGFMDQIAAYDRLPQRLKDEIEGLSIIYEFDINLENSRFGNTWGATILHAAHHDGAATSRLQDQSRSLHPMTYTQEGTGRKVLNVSPWFAIGIKDHEDAAGDTLLREVIDVVADEEHAYYHRWQAGDMVLWDNWRMLHCAPGVPAEVPRAFQRTTIAGDYGHGRPDKVQSAPG